MGNNKQQGGPKYFCQSADRLWALVFFLIIHHPSSEFPFLLLLSQISNLLHQFYKNGIYEYICSKQFTTYNNRERHGRKKTIRKSTTNNKQTQQTNKQTKKTNKIYFINRRRREWKKVSSVTIYNVFLKAISTSSCLRMLYACIIWKNRTTFLQTLRNI